MQLRLDAADRLVELVEERRGPVYAEEAARLAWSGDSVRLATPPGHDLPLERATYVVVDLETTGLRPGTCRICEIGAVRVRELELGETFQTLANPGMALGRAVPSLTGLRDRELRRAASAAEAVRRFLDFAGDAVLVAHNARFALAFLDRERGRLRGRRLAGPVVDTVSLARRVLEGRSARASLASLAHFFGTSVRPCHRALPDATATAEILLALIGLAQERGATSVADLCELASTRTRRIYLKRSLAFGAPTTPGVYLFRDEYDQVLYVGRARDLRARLRSYFRIDRQRPAVEAALEALERIEWRELGSELEAALEELGLTRELRPPANARVARPDRYVYLRRRGEGFVCSSRPGELGPIRSRTRARLAARALAGASEDELDRLLSGGPLPRRRARVRALAESLRYEDAARLRDRVDALDRVVSDLRRLDRLRRARCCVVVPALEAGFVRAVFLAAGRVVDVRSLPPGEGARLEVETALALCRRAEPTLEPEAADELLLVGSFLRRPPPELAVCPLELEPILAARARIVAFAATPAAARAPAPA